jgi:hypothetical protein
MPTLSVRMAPEEMLELERASRERGLTKSELVLEVLRDHLLRPPEKSVYDLAVEAGAVGCFEGPGDLAARHSYYVKKKLREKHARRHRAARRAS